MIIPSAKQLQIRDAESLRLLIVAPAGCGKTEALALRVQGLLARGLVVAPRKILVITFSNRARDNIKDRLRTYLTPTALRDRVTVVNFHGLSARLIKSHGNVVGLLPNVSIPERDWIDDWLREEKLSWAARGQIQETLRVLKQQSLDDDEVGVELAKIGNSYASRVEQIRRQQGILTYDDLPRFAELILKDKQVADLYSSHFGAVIVDEYQDLTPQQLRIVNHFAKDRTTYAGDLAQGIYGFAGALPDEIDDAIRAKCDTVIEFSESHRSSPAVLGLVNSLVGLTSGSELTCADPKSWPSGGFSSTISHADAATEATWIFNLARALITKVPTHRIGVIARTSGRRRFVDEAFASSDVSHYRWDDGVLDTDTSKVVKAMLSSFNLASYLDSADEMSFLRDAASLDSIVDTDVRKNLVDALGWVQDLLAQNILPSEIRARIKIGDSTTLITVPGVHLLSGHVGKGQQFDWVIVVGLEEDFIPFFTAKKSSEIAEEARILSVMISRARHGVVLSHARDVPQADGASRRRSPSRFLKQIGGSKPMSSEDLIASFKVADWESIAKR